MTDTVDEYLSNQPESIRPILDDIREVIRTNAPDAQETISWGMPTYKASKIIVHFAAQKKHVGLYPGPEAIEFFTDRLKGFETSKGTIRFPYDEPIPFDLIAEVVRHNMQNR